MRISINDRIYRGCWLHRDGSIQNLNGRNNSRPIVDRLWRSKWESWENGHENGHIVLHVRLGSSCIVKSGNNIFRYLILVGLIF
jgi:hypothetical protein